MSLIPSGVAAPGGLAGSPSHFSVQVIWTCSPGLWAPSGGVSGVAGVAGLAGVVLSWMSWTCAGGDTGEEADFDYETRGKEDEGGFTCTLHEESQLRWKCRNAGKVTESHSVWERGRKDKCVKMFYVIFTLRGSFCSKLVYITLPENNLQLQHKTVRQTSEI